MNIRKNVVGMLPYQPGKPIAEVKRELGLSEVIKLASNENNLGPSNKVIKAIKKATSEIGFYPDGSSYALRQALANKLKVSSNNIIVGNGSNELLVLLGLALLNPGDEVLTSDQTFIVYKMVADLMQAKLVTVPLEKYTYNLPALLKKITSKTKIIFIANPNNPTGTAVAKQAVHDFLQKVPSSCLVVLDEAYHEYASYRIVGNSIPWVKQYSNLVVLRTFSKAYGLAGLRLGYGAASPDICEAIHKVRDPFNINVIAQIAGIAALEDQQHIKKSVALVNSEKKRVSKLLTKLNLKVVPSQTNFLWVELPQGQTSEVFSKKMLQQGIIIRPFKGSYIRITLGRVSENNRMLKVIRNVLASI